MKKDEIKQNEIQPKCDMWNKSIIRNIKRRNEAPI